MHGGLIRVLPCMELGVEISYPKSLVSTRGPGIEGHLPGYLDQEFLN